MSECEHEANFLACRKCYKVLAITPVTDLIGQLQAERDKSAKLVEEIESVIFHFNDNNQKERANYFRSRLNDINALAEYKENK